MALGVLVGTLLRTPFKNLLTSCKKWMQFSWQLLVTALLRSASVWAKAILSSWHPTVQPVTRYGSLRSRAWRFLPSVGPCGTSAPKLTSGLTKTWSDFVVLCHAFHAQSSFLSKWQHYGLRAFATESCVFLPVFCRLIFILISSQSVQLTKDLKGSFFKCRKELTC